MKHLQETEGAQGLTINYAFPKFSLDLGKMNQWSFTLAYWDRKLELEFFRWFLYIDFSSKNWEMWDYAYKQGFKGPHSNKYVI